MSRSNLFSNLTRIIGIAHYCEQKNITTAEGLEQIARLEKAAAQHRVDRREFIRGTAKLAAAAAVAAAGWPLQSSRAAPPSGAGPSVAIIGAGLAGLACADELKRNGLLATLYDANDRVGGRCFSLSNFFPGQVAERGGEFIDNVHKTMLGYAQQFKLELEDVEKMPGAVFYYFNGRHYPESAVVDEFRALVPAMRADLRLLTPPTAERHSAADIALDFTNLRDYLDSRGAGALVKKAIEQAYIAEYGLEIERQSCLNFLLFTHADRRSKFRPFGIFSDERYHVVGGNEQIAAGLAARVSGQIKLDRRLVRVRKTAAGRVELVFQAGGKSWSATHDAVVFAIPFSTLREVSLDSSLGLPPWKLLTINELRYGTNAKMMLGFTGRPWLALGSKGASYSDLPNHQATWETSPVNATEQRAVLTDYSGGDRGLNLNPKRLQSEASRFLADLDRVYPGAAIAAVRAVKGNLLAHLEHWPSNPLVKGSYTCNHPGYFTTLADNEAKPVGNLYFAGEHTSSFYEWQGFMEGAALSGIRAAKEILRDSKAGVAY